MNLCDDGHAEVCHEGRNCPACDLKQQLEEKESNLSAMDDKCDQLADEVSGLKSEIKSLNERL